MYAVEGFFITISSGVAFSGNAAARRGGGLHVSASHTVLVSGAVEVCAHGRASRLQ